LDCLTVNGIAIGCQTLTGILHHVAVLLTPRRMVCEISAPVFQKAFKAFSSRFSCFKNGALPNSLYGKGS
jgi:hypothetical protein